MGRAEFNTSRNLLHIDKLEDFKAWALEQGWKQETPKSIYEALRLRMDKHVVIIHKKDRTQGGKALVHLTTHGASTDLVRKWLKDRKT